MYLCIFLTIGFLSTLEEISSTTNFVLDNNRVAKTHEYQHLHLLYEQYLD